MSLIEEKTNYFRHDCKKMGLSEETCNEYASVIAEYLLATHNPAINFDATYQDHKKSLNIFSDHLQNQQLSYSRIKFKITAVNNYYRMLLDDG